MLPQHQEFNGIRKTIPEDIDYLAPRLRYEDKREVLDGYGLNPYQALKISFNTAEICLTIIDKQNIPVGIFGVTADGSPDYSTTRTIDKGMQVVSTTE